MLRNIVRNYHKGKTLNKTGKINLSKNHNI